MDARGRFNLLDFKCEQKHIAVTFVDYGVMMPVPFITTVIPTYRRPRLLRRAVLSALRQTYPHVLVYVYDNASGDETESMVAEISATDDRVYYCRHAENIGYVRNIIFGVGAVNTPYFSILSDDDLLAPWFYARAMAGFTCHPDAMFSALDSVKINETGAILAGPVGHNENHARYYAKGDVFKAVVRRQVSMPWVGTVFRFEVIQELGPLDAGAGPNLNDSFVLHVAARYAGVVSSVVGCLITESHNSVGAGMHALNADWHSWWKVVRGRILTDAHVSEQNRLWAHRWLVLDFRRIVCQQVVHGLGQFGHRDFKYASQAAVGVGKCGYPVTSVLLRSAVWLYTNCLSVRAIVDWFIAGRKQSTTAQRQLLTLRYAYLAEYVASLETVGEVPPSFSLKSKRVDQSGRIPLITTVIPTYRRPLWLRRAVLSALRQSYPHLLVLVCDNGSDDETAEAVRRLSEEDPRVLYHRHSANLGSYSNFNFGIQSVNTQYFSLLSDDDVLLPDFYRRSLGALERFPEAMFTCMSTMVMDISGNVVSEPAGGQGERLNAQAEGLLGNRLRPIPGAWTGILFRTRVREEIGLIATDAGPFADGSFVLHAAARFPFVDVPGIGAVLTSHPASTSATVKPVDSEWLLWWEHMIQRIERDEHVPYAARRRIRSKAVMEVAGFDLSDIARKQVMGALFAGNLERAMQVASGAKECGFPCTGRLIASLVSIERWTGLVQPVLKLAKALLRAWRRRSIARLSRRYMKEVAMVRQLDDVASN